VTGFNQTFLKVPAADQFVQRDQKYLLAGPKSSERIDPLIVVEDKEGPYILEGGHRFDALRILKTQSFSASVVMDLDSLGDSTETPEWLEVRSNIKITRLYRAEAAPSGNKPAEWIREAQRPLVIQKPLSVGLPWTQRRSNGTNKTPAHERGLFI
jgi:hypothetical protein